METLDEPVFLSSRSFLPDAVHWSEDNQVAVVAANAVHILTPSETRNSENRHIVHRTCIATITAEHKLRLKRPYDETAVRPAELSVEAVRSAAWSPAGVSEEGGCVLATLSTSHRVCLWYPEMHPATSAWTEILDVTKLLIGQLGAQASRRMPLETFRKIETLSLSWSPLFLGKRAKHLAFLALGSKSGHVTLWSYTNELQYAAWFQPTDAWISVLSWSPSFVMPTAHWCSFLAIGDSKGRILVYKVSMDQDAADRQLSGPVIEMHAELQTEGQVTPGAFCWCIDKARHRLGLAASRANTIMIWETSTDGEKSAIANPVACPSYLHHGSMPVAGMSWNHMNGVIWAFTLDGKAIVLRYANCQLALDAPASAALELGMHKRCREAESGRTVDDDDAEKGEKGEQGVEPGGFEIKLRPQFLGLSVSTHGIYLAVVYTMTSCADLEYKTEKRRVSSLLFVNTADAGDLELEQHLETQLLLSLQQPELVSPSFLLWDVFTYAIRTPYVAPQAVQNAVQAAEHHFLNRIMQELVLFYSTSQEVALPATGDDDAEVAFADALFLDTGAQAIRLLIHIQRHLLNYVSLEDRKLIETNLSSNAAITFGLYLQKVFALIIADLEKLEGKPLPDILKTSYGLLADWALATYHDRPAMMNAAWTIWKAVTPVRSVEGGEDFYQQEPREWCHACAAPVPLQSLTFAYCANGHYWERCSATLLIIASPNVRSCLGCNRKVVILDHPGIFPRMVAAVKKCLFCGTRFGSKLRL